MELMWPCLYGSEIVGDEYIGLSKVVNCLSILQRVAHIHICPSGSLSDSENVMSNRKTLKGTERTAVSPSTETSLKFWVLACLLRFTGRWIEIV